MRMTQFFLPDLGGGTEEDGNRERLRIGKFSVRKYTSFCCATIRARPVGLRGFLRRLTELGNFMGFQVDGLMVNGLTMDKTTGARLQSDL